MTSQSTLLSDRRRWMSALATAPAAVLSNSWQGLSVQPDFTWISPPQFETIMLRARADGSGMVFNFGEMTVTRCSLALGNGIAGIACIGGRDKRHAAVAAVFDAMMLCPDGSQWHALAREAVLAAEAASNKHVAARAAKARATEVAFSMSVAEQPK
ncbi:phosphonate C-P lyase system protein PhnG [Bradyrhizobium uaiense]|uniref:Phosphonate C-P lyase system protein PhnG n=1 Tax=Bradyrhizobium uaiense TaxID=2594946 RepID=A0A6P1BMN8_9BRAD|nr:phosphonate C-P lyase system protein PhnG [Bradyrhizobium uaiense]NEU98890.1 phosphonate C-P lyase system protein PhnG [Bradyrhizobium uaiense]